MLCLDEWIVNVYFCGDRIVDKSCTLILIAKRDVSCVNLVTDRAHELQFDTTVLNMSLISFPASTLLFPGIRFTFPLQNTESIAIAVLIDVGDSVLR